MVLFTDEFKELKKASEPLYKSPKSIEQIGKYTRERWTDNARSVGAPARYEMTKIKISGVTKQVYKDTYNKHNKLLHRKYKYGGR